MKLIEQLVERNNMEKAYWHVVRNKGAAGIDNMTVEQLKPYLQNHWVEIKEKLLNGKYKPQPVKEGRNTKSNRREKDTWNPRGYRPTYSAGSTPNPQSNIRSNIFRVQLRISEGRSAHQAILQAKKYQQEGRKYVVDMDIEKFFDEVNHDILMSRIARKVKDKQILLLIRKYLQSGIMENGIQMQREKGTPQGSPLSPLLSNIILDELDKELEKRGHKFCVMQMTVTYTSEAKGRDKEY